MDFDFDDDHKMLKEQLHAFAANEVATGAAERDRNASMTDELLQQLAGLGLFGIAIPDKYGGAGMGTAGN